MLALLLLILWPVAELLVAIKVADRVRPADVDSTAAHVGAARLAR